MRSFNSGWAALALIALTPVAQAATIYVSNTSTGACSPPTTGCGGYTNPFRNLRQAIEAAQPGDEIAIWGTSANKPYYYYDQGTPQASIGQSLMALNKFNTAQPTLIRGIVGSPKPIIRGTLVYKKPSWTLDSQNTNGYLYRMPWVLKQGTAPEPQEPQQVFRDSLPDGQRQLKQVGGKVFHGNAFAGYYPGVDLSTIAPDLATGYSQVGNLWPGYTSYVSLASLTANQFYYDRVAKVLYVRLSSQLATDEGIEVSALQFIANGFNMANVTLQNMIFERSNTSTYWRGGAVLITGNNLKVDGVEFRDSDSHCLQIEGNNNTVQNSTFKRCGQVGLVANGSNAKVKGNYFTGNNDFRKFNADWEAGPTKFIGNNGLDNSEISENVITANSGHGIWLDTGNTGNLVKDNVSAYNQIGIALENSAQNTIQSNVIFGNRSQGINLRGATSTLVKSNLLVGNFGDGIFVHSSGAGNDPSTGLRVLGNTFAWHDEATGNKKPVWVPPSATLFDNRYCGTIAANGSLHFWLQDWNPDPNLGYANNVFNWTSWRSVKTSPTNPTAPAYDNDSLVHADNDSTKTSVMQLTGTVPANVAAWQATPNLSLTGYPNGVTNTRNSIQAIVTQYCL
jgi:parallel beta-helix repeat protein